jgi:hypothetical protein
MSDVESEKERKRRELMERLRQNKAEKKGETRPAGKASAGKPAAGKPAVPPAGEKGRDVPQRQQALRDRMEQARGQIAGRDAKSEAPPDLAQRTRSEPARPATPPVTPEKPPVTAGKPPVTAGKPPVTAGKPPATAGKPPATAGKPPLTPGKPPAAAGPTQRAATRGTRGFGDRSNRPLPPPPARHTVQPARVAAELSPEVKREIDNLYSRYSKLEGDAQLGSVYQGIAEIEKLLVEIPVTVDGLRSRGYVHSGRLESQLDSYQGQWESLRPRIESALSDHSTRLNGDLSQTSRRVQTISNGNAALIAGAKTAVDGLSSKVDAARRALESLYNNLLTQLRQLNRSLGQVSTMMGLLDAAPEIHLRPSEGPLVAAQSQWLQNGKEGPEGVLFLTDQRLLFEQRQEIVTKRTLGIFKKESEKIQKVLIEAEVTDIESVSHNQEGGFLGMGKAEILELAFGGRASVSRARFQVKGQEASEWAALLKRVQNGDIHRDRHEQYVAEMEAASNLQFPTQCPNCFAAVPTPPRGARSVTCEFCNAVINPI